MLKRVSSQRLSHKKDIVCPETGVAGKEDREGEGRVEARTHTHTHTHLTLRANAGRGETPVVYLTLSVRRNTQTESVNGGAGVYHCLVMLWDITKRRTTGQINMNLIKHNVQYKKAKKVPESNQTKRSHKLKRFHPKMKILSLITQPHVIPNLQDLSSSSDHN